MNTSSRTSGKKIPDASRSRGIQLLKQNLPIQVIMQRLGVSKTTVQGWRKSLASSEQKK